MVGGVAVAGKAGAPGDAGRSSDAARRFRQTLARGRRELRVAAYWSRRTKEFRRTLAFARRMLEPGRIAL